MTPEQPAAPNSPITLTGDGLMIGQRQPIPDQPAAVVLSILAAGGLARADLAVPVGEHLDNLINALTELRTALPKANGLHTATAADLGRINGRH